MAARRAPVETMEPAASSSGQSKVMLMTPPDAGSAVEILGEGPEAAPAIVDIMGKSGPGMSVFLYLVEHDRGRIDETTLGG